MKVLDALCAATLASAALACSKPQDVSPPTPTAPPGPVTAAPSTPAVKEERATVTLTGTQGERAVKVEVVASPRAVERGLMYRTHLPLDEGMLFLMGEEEVHSFWMRNTLIPLDILFIDKDLKVVGIVENAEPRTETSRTVGIPSSYVLEVNGGWCAANGIAAGATVRLSDNARAVAH